MKRFICGFLTVLLCLGLKSQRAAAFQLPSPHSAVVINGLTGTVLFQKDDHKRMPMASTTKIMTAILLLENIEDLDGEIVVTKEMVTVEGSSMGLLEGDTVSFRALLYGMMLPSGNDAANTVAYALAGSVENFAVMMNKKAAEIGMNNTCFVTPSGLDDQNHYSTAYDMALLARYALENQDFKEACSTKSIRLEYGNPPCLRTISGHNKLLDLYDGAIGVKTGYTSRAGKCLVSAAQRDSGFIIAVSLNDPDFWNSHISMLNYGFSVLEEKTLDTRLDDDTVAVVSGRADRVRISCEEAKVFLSELEAADIKREVYLPRFVYAPVAQGQRIGYIEYRLGGKVIAESNIIAEATVEEKTENVLTERERFFGWILALIKAGI